jgi:aldehyde:ferredoxin oxidoreductase
LSVTALLSQYGEGKVEKLIDFNAHCNEIGVEHIYITALLLQEDIGSKKSIKKMVSKVYKEKLTSGFNQIKGMAMPPWDPRGNQGLYLAMALNPSGPRYDVIEHDIDFDANWVWERHVEYGKEFGVPEGGIPLGTLEKNREKSIGDLWLLWSALDALGVCIYAAPPTRELRTKDIIDMVKSVVNKEITIENLYELGLIRLLMQRDFNHKLGLGAQTDSLPERFFEQPIEESNAKLNGAIIKRAEFNQMKSAIYSRFGWSEMGGVDESSALWQKCRIDIEQVAGRILPLCE